VIETIYIDDYERKHFINKISAFTICVVVKFVSIAAEVAEANQRIARQEENQL